MYQFPYIVPDNSLEGKRRLSAPSYSTPNPKRAKLTTVDKKGMLYSLS